MNRPPTLPVIIGTGFGAGFWPWGPGTAGAVLATLIWLGLSCVLSVAQLAIVTFLLVVVFTIAGTWATERLQPYWGDDPSRVVVDEMVGVWIPLIIAGEPEMKWWWAAAALLLFRFFDIVKPLGIRSLDRRKGAIWVMLDDVLAGIYSAIVLGIIIAIYHAMA
ncbi:MAG: phosphatidylglycerophosphatase A [Muribaculaceae bacterium]|nr:phosphatidylglycerophosphatase A [Muribaculaceae bacterium]